MERGRGVRGERKGKRMRGGKSEKESKQERGGKERVRGMGREIEKEGE